jgi:hypothetical protein
MSPVRCLNFAASGFDQFDLITIGIFDKRDDRVTAFHRTGFAGYPAAGRPDSVTGIGDIVDAERDMTVSCALL